MDAETCSIHSNAPSYLSAVPSYTSQDVPPYSATIPRPSNPRYTSLLPQVSARIPSGAGGLPSALEPRPSHLPPMAWIGPGNRPVQSRQCEAVAARRQAKSNSNNTGSSRAIEPRARTKRAYSTPHYSIPPVSENFSSLHPSPSTPQAFQHSTAELFLCTCGRPNHRKVQQESLFAETENTTRRTVSLGGPSDARAPLQRIIDNAAVEEDEEEEKPLEDPLVTEDRAWDFLISQMADWDEREQRWQEFRTNQNAWKRFVTRWGKM